ncbi:MAG: [Fe-Fe] hydrogenase large subunit C-terminal domain-containing protein, partial [Bacteroidales bacterium]
EHGVGYMISFFNDYFKKYSDKNVFVSSFCPAVVRLIQVRFPGLVENIIHLKAPLDVSAIMITQRLTEAGIQKEDIGVFYITPCAAKIAAVKSPVENTKSIINGVINMDFLYNKVQKMLHTDKSNVEPINHSLTGRDVKWSLSGGEASNFGENAFAVDGLKNVIEFLEKLENDEIDTSGLIEMRVCDQSCAGGILNVNNRFVAVQRLLKRANYLDQKLDGRYCFVPEIGTNFYSRVAKQMEIDEIKPRPIDKLANNYKTALLMKNEIEKIKAKLPSIDCGACGSPNCAALAEDIVKGFASIDNCVFLDDECKSIKRINTEIWNNNKTNK